MLGSSILVSLATLLVSFVSFANQVILARLFGTSISMDAYLIAVSAPMLISGVLSATLGYSLVPALITHKSNFSVYRCFSGLLLLSFIVLSMCISIAGYFAAPIQIRLLGEVLSFPAQQDAIAIARVSWLTAGVVLIVGHLNAMHNADNRFLWPIFASMVPFVSMIVAGLIFAPVYGPLAVAWGMLAGFLLVIPALLIRALPALDFSIRCLFQRKDVAGYLFRAPLIMLAMLCFTIFQSVDAYWAPQIGAGNLAYLGYSQRILVALGSLVIAGPAAVILPRLADAYADGRIEDLLHDTQRAVRVVVFFALPVALSVSILATSLVRLLFERGAFNSHATQNVAAIMPLMMVGMVAMLCVVIIFRALYAKHDIFRASLLGIMITVLYFCLSGLLSQRFGVEGIALAYALSWWLVLLLSILVLWRGYMRMIFCRDNFVFAAQVAVLAVVTGVVVWAGKYWLEGFDVSDGLLIFRLGMVGFITVFVYFIVAVRVLGIEDVRLVYTFLFSKCVLLMPRLKNKST